MLGGDGGFATARWREPASSDRLPSHRSESPTGYSSAGCSPPEPASASPVTDNSSSILIQRGNQIRCSTFTAAMQFRPRSSCPPPTGGVISTLRAGCHFYLAPTFLEIVPVYPAQEMRSCGDVALVMLSPAGAHQVVMVGSVEPAFGCSLVGERLAHQH